MCYKANKTNKNRTGKSEREVEGSLPWPTVFYKTLVSEFSPLI